MAGSTDSPDYANTTAAPAIDLGAFTVPANTVQTVYNGPTPPGCHSLKVFVKSTDPNNNAQQVTVIDPSTATTMVAFPLVRGTSVIAQVDDVCTPNIRVDVFGAALQATTGRVVAYLSDQAVWIDNDVNSPVPVGGGTPSGAVPAQLAGGIPFNAISSAGNTAVNIPFLAQPGIRYFVHAVSCSFSGATAGAPSIQIQAGAGPVTVWEVNVAETAAGNPVHHFPFPNGGLWIGPNTAMNILLTASGAAGIFGVLNCVVEERSV